MTISVVTIIWWLLVAAIVGFALGWLVRKWLLDRDQEDAYAEFRAQEERRRGELSAELEDHKAKADRLSLQLDHRAADLERAQAQIVSLESTATDLDEKLTLANAATFRLEAMITDRESTIAALRSKIDKGRENIGLLETNFSEATDTVNSLRADAAAKEVEISALGAKAATAAESADQLAALSASLSASRGAEQELQGRVAELESESTAQLAAIAALETQLSAMANQHDTDVHHEEPAAPTVAHPESLVEHPSPADGTADKNEAVVKVAEIAARTRGAEPAVDDDLKKIHGIGPKLEGLLKSMDITSFRQVAAFTADDIQHITAALDGFPGRIERDDWMSSAAEEHSKRYGD